MVKVAIVVASILAVANAAWFPVVTKTVTVIKTSTQTVTQTVTQAGGSAPTVWVPSPTTIQIPTPPAQLPGLPQCTSCLPYKCIGCTITSTVTLPTPCKIPSGAACPTDTFPAQVPRCPGCPTYSCPQSMPTSYVVHTCTYPATCQAPEPTTSPCPNTIYNMFGGV